MPLYATPRTLCLSGTVQPAPEVDIFQRGTHRLTNEYGAVIATLTASQVNLTDWVGQYVTACGIDEGVIEGVHSLRVTQVHAPGTAPDERSHSGVPLLTTPLLFWLPLPWLLSLWRQSERAEP